MNFKRIKLFLSLVFVLLSACGVDNNPAPINNKATTVVPASLQKFELGDNNGELRAYLTIDGDSESRREMAIDPSGAGSATIAVPGLSRDRHDITITYEYTLAGITYEVAVATRDINLAEGDDNLAFVADDYNLNGSDDDGDGFSNAAELKARSNPRDELSRPLPSLAFTTRWKTDNTGSVNTGPNQIKIGVNPQIGVNPKLSYNYTVSWGDGEINTNVTGDIIHTYATADTYTIEIRGIFPQLFFGNSSDLATPLSDYDASKLVSIEQWGGIEWKSMSRAFLNCNNLQGNANDVPNLSGVTDMSSMFEGASIFNQNIGGWNVSTITNMAGMFRNANAFNQNIGRWNVSSVMNMKNMFHGASVFNQNIAGWNVSSVTDMAEMFRNANAFNQNINRWDVSSVTDMRGMFRGANVFNQNIGSWNVSLVKDMNRMFFGASVFNQDIRDWDVFSVISMNRMFRGASDFNQNIDRWNVSSVTDMILMFSSTNTFNQNIGGWDVSSVTKMGGMFDRASAFNQDISAWDVSSVTDMNNMFNATALSTSNYDALLIGWSSLILENGVFFGAGDSTYSVAAEAAKNTMTTNFGWTISDGGLAQ